VGALSFKDYNDSINDFKFDYVKTRVCAFDGCRKALSSVSMVKHRVLNNKRYCSLICLKKQYRSLSYEGATHLVHQAFGPEHPVTKQIKKMKEELSSLKKEIDMPTRCHSTSCLMTIFIKEKQ
jgi:hypothetical protein